MECNLSKIPVKKIEGIRANLSNMKGIAYTEETVFVIGILIIASIILVSSSAFISGVDLPYMDNGNGFFDSNYLENKIKDCVKDVERGSEIIECNLDNVKIDKDIEEREINLERYEVSIQGGKLINSTRVDLGIRYNSIEDNITVRKFSECNPWKGDNCTDINCSCEGQCVLENPEIERIKGDRLGCYKP